MSIPEVVAKTIQDLEKAGFEAYLVGGCVRDFLIGRETIDWDITTNAIPEEIQKVFSGARYDNEFGTVTVLENGKATKRLSDEAIKIEVTTFREESGYSDSRHPDEVKFVKTIEEDLARRDFTINAMAMKPDASVIDPHGGKKDLEAKAIRAVGDPSGRFGEDALRMMRGVRFASQLGFEIEADTWKAILEHSTSLKDISQERVRDELTKVINSENAAQGVDQFRESGLLEHFLPELLEGYGVGQNKHHTYEVYEHNLKSLEWAVKFGYSFEVRLASLLHDVGKPATKEGDGIDSTFHRHEIVGAQMTRKALTRLRYPKKTVERITHLVRHHLFFYDIGAVSERGVRRMLTRVGKEHIQDLIHVRMAERKGSGVPKARPYRLRHLEYMLDKVADDPITTSMLKYNGNDIMKDFDLKPGRKIGLLLNALLSEVLDDPEKNTKAILKSRVEELLKLDDKQVAQIGEEVKKHQNEREQERKGKYHVK